jgi:hypothetical protein
LRLLTISFLLLLLVQPLVVLRDLFLPILLRFLPMLPFFVLMLLFFILTLKG